MIAVSRLCLAIQPPFENPFGRGFYLVISVLRRGYSCEVTCFHFQSVPKKT